MKKEKIKCWDIVVGFHGNRAEIGRVVGVDEVHRISTYKLKPRKFAYHVKYSGATEGFHLNARNLKKLNEWQAGLVKEVLKF